MIPDVRDENQDSGPADGQPDDSLPPDAHQDVVTTTDPAVVPDRPGGVRCDATIVAETSHGTESKDFAEPTRIGPPGGEVSKWAEPQAQAEGPSKGHEGDHRGDRSRPDHPNRLGWLDYVLTCVVALVCGVGGAWAYSFFASSKYRDQADVGDRSRQAKKDDDGSSSKKGSSNSQARGHDDAPSGGSVSLSSNEAPTGGDDNLKDLIQNLSSRFDVLRQRVEALSMPRDTNPPDLTSVRIRMDELSRTALDVKGFPSRFREMENRLDRLHDEIKGLPVPRTAESEPGGYPANAPMTGEAKPKIKTPAAPVPPDSNSPEEVLAAGTELFKKGKYAQAEAIFRNLQQTKPEDARVWYFSALANGLATGRWDGEARSFVIQGADRERAGLPATSVIDSSLADLSPATGKNWLASYRSQLVKR